MYIYIYINVNLYYIYQPQIFDPAHNRLSRPEIELLFFVGSLRTQKTMENKAATMENGEIPEDANERKLFLLCY